MIARLSGTLVEAGADYAVIDVGGVGYIVQASARTLSAIGGVGSAVTLPTETVVREDAITLYAFASGAERGWFRLLTGIQGVGARVALAILSVLAPDDLARAVAGGDQASVARAQGVGPKLAQRVVNELKDKAGALGAVPGAGAPVAAQPAGSVRGDAAAALGSLGFKPGEAATLVDAAVAELGDHAGLDAVVRLALRRSAR